MRFSLKLTIIAANLLFTAAVLAVEVAAASNMTSEMAEILDIEQNWLLGAAVLYTMTYLASWRFRGVFSVSATRMLAWAIAAYVVMSHGIDVLGEYRGEIPSIFGLEQSTADPALLTGIRVRLLGLVAILAMALTAIAVGFESAEEETGGN